MSVEVDPDFSEPDVALLSEELEEELAGDAGLAEVVEAGLLDAGLAVEAGLEVEVDLSVDVGAGLELLDVEVDLSVEAFLAGAFFAGAFLAAAFLAGAFLAGALLAGAVRASTLAAPLWTSSDTE